eukprot:TRINITY_DN4517_c0_g1_i4.p1 TRINITY_DN4517_c0_g1~~TRINITY_DN4517_c0_g1_i4.p1  ORF type:complete len:368 (-),score=46.29 TRINITY_DN4517_c0_g1_i4:160-1263(-)
MIQAALQQSKPSEADLAEETHAIAARKKAQMDKLKDAFGLGEVREGEAFNQELKEQKRIERLQQIEEQKAKEKQEKKEKRKKLKKIEKEKERLKKQLQKEKREILKKQKELQQRARQRRRSLSSSETSSSSSGSQTSSEDTSSSGGSRGRNGRNQKMETKRGQFQDKIQYLQRQDNDNIGRVNNQLTNQHIQDYRDGGRKRERYYSNDSDGSQEREGRQRQRQKVDNKFQDFENDTDQAKQSLQQISEGQRKSRFDQMERPVLGSKVQTLRSKVVASQDNLNQRNDQYRSNNLQKNSPQYKKDQELEKEEQRRSQGPYYERQRNEKSVIEEDGRKNLDDKGRRRDLEKRSEKLSRRRYSSSTDSDRG